MRDADLQRAMEELDRLARFGRPDDVRRRIADMRRLVIQARTELQQVLIRSEQSIARAEGILRSREKQRA